MSEFLKNTLFPYLDKGDVLVFPTEESARSVAVEYVLNQKKALFKDRCLSFDAFSEKLYDTEGKDPVSDYDKEIFCNYFIERHAEKLKYIYSPEFPEMKSFLPSYIKNMLSDLDDTADSNLGCKDLKWDLDFIRREYGIFLSKNNLYDIAFIKPSFFDGYSSQCKMISPEIYPKEAKFLKRLSESNRIEKISICQKKAPLSVFDEEKAEIRSLFLNIRKLTDSGIGMENIAISASGFDRIKQYLKQESKLFDVPLVFMKADSILSSVPGLFLSKLKQLYDDEFRIEDMKTFFLDPAFAFESKDEIISFISQAVQLSIVSSIDGNEDRFLKISFPDKFNYRKFKAATEKLMRETNPSSVASELVFLLTFLLGEDYFKGNDLDNKAMGMILSQLASFLESVKMSQRSGYHLEKPLFPLFLTALEHVSYVENAIKEGIKVYPFSQAASIPFDHHFLICLNEKESQKVIRDGAFLSDYERDGLDEGTYIAEGLLSSYIAFNEHVHLSFSKNTSSGAMLPLSCLSEYEVKGKLEGEDSWRLESSGKAPSKVFRLQKESFERAKHSSLTELDSKAWTLSEAPKKPELSFTSVSEYEKCPFSYSLKYEYGMRSLPSYDVMKMDNKELGNRIHSILERFFRHDGSDPENNLRKYFNEEMDAWRNGLRFEYSRSSGEERLEKMERGALSATDVLVEYVYRTFFSNLVAAAKDIIEESLPYEDGLEMSMRATFSEDGFSLVGKADKVAIDKTSGDLIVYDYKSGRSFSKKEIPEKQLQFFIYRFLLEKKGEHVEKGEFVFLKDNKKHEVLKYSSADDDFREFERLISASDGIKSGVRSLATSFDVCKSCAFKAICRRNMVVR